MNKNRNLDHLNDLPKRSRSHVIEQEAQTAFEKVVTQSECFFLQKVDINDFGTDYQLEVESGGSATNVRVHVQLKGTGKKANDDGSVSIPVDRSNLNYLLAQPYSFYACYHVPSGRLLIASVDEVVAKYDNHDGSWTEQKTITVMFSRLLDLESLRVVAELARLQCASARDRRYQQTSAINATVNSMVTSATPEIYVPNDSGQAAKLLEQLYRGNREEAISEAFERFEAVVGSNNDAMRFCHMAEINLGMASPDRPNRIAAGISFLVDHLALGRFEPSGLHFSIGNGHSALGNQTAAIASYKEALKCFASDDVDLIAQCLKNKGSSYFSIGERDKAEGCFTRALELSPQLPEAHYALGILYLREGRYEEALQSLDNVVFGDGRFAKTASVAGWRVNCLFNIGDSKAAFREINTLLAHATTDPWIWPWCARQVASFGRSSPEFASHSVVFWKRYNEANPENEYGEAQLLLSLVFLRMNGFKVEISYEQFKRRFLPLIDRADPSEAGFLWDRLGHFAQEERIWEEAERCFRKACEVDERAYGYCLGTALNELKRGAEAIDFLIVQAQEAQPDAMSWFQLALAYEQNGQIPESIDAYETAINLDPDYGVAWFNLGGVYWNIGAHDEAQSIWSQAVKKFPGREEVAILRRDFNDFLHL